MNKLELMIAQAKAEAAASWAVATAEIVRERAAGIYRFPATLAEAQSEGKRLGYASVTESPTAPGFFTYHVA
jgi:hypothetical protein